MAAKLDKRLEARMSAALKAVIEDEARRMGMDASEWMRLAAVHFAVSCQILDLADEHGARVDLRDPEAIRRLLGE